MRKHAPRPPAPARAYTARCSGAPPHIGTQSFPYQSWILSQTIDHATMSESDGHIRIQSDNAFCEVNFYDIEMPVTELRITRTDTGETTFFLHFELKNLTYAKSLFRDMLDSFAETMRPPFLPSCGRNCRTLSSFFQQPLPVRCQKFLQIPDRLQIFLPHIRILHQQSLIHRFHHRNAGRVLVFG